MCIYCLKEFELLAVKIWGLMTFFLCHQLELLWATNTQLMAAGRNDKTFEVVCPGVLFALGQQ